MQTWYVVAPSWEDRDGHPGSSLLLLSPRQGKVCMVADWSLLEGQTVCVCVCIWCITNSNIDPSTWYNLLPCQHIHYHHKMNTLPTSASPMTTPLPNFLHLFFKMVCKTAYNSVNSLHTIISPSIRYSISFPSRTMVSTPARILLSICASSRPTFSDRSILSNRSSLSSFSALESLSGFSWACFIISLFLDRSMSPATHRLICFLRTGERKRERKKTNTSQHTVKVPCQTIRPPCKRCQMPLATWPIRPMNIGDDTIRPMNQWDLLYCSNSW